MVGHIFDIDVLITTTSQPWIVNKNNPNEALMKISKSDYNLFKNGVYKKAGNKIEYNDKVYWLPSDLYEKLKVIAKNRRMTMDDMAISLQEFLNEDLIEEQDFTINYDVISGLKNKTEDIYLLCSNNTKTYFGKLIEKLLNKLKEEGISIKDTYYTNETFFNSETDEIMYKKATICLEHLVGYKISNNKFIDEKVEQYSKLYYYDNDLETLKMVNQSNSILKYLVNNTKIGLKDVVKEDIKENKSTFIVNKITSNKFNRFITEDVLITLSNILTFESFKWNKH
jgi:hypothetical protein